MAKKKAGKAGDGKATVTVAPPAMKAMKAMKTVEETMTFTLTELGKAVSEAMFSCLAGTPDARPWEQCLYEGDFIAMRIFEMQEYEK